jgi:CRISPR-associated endonuclease Cas2
MDDASEPSSFEHWLLCYDTDDDAHRAGLSARLSAVGERAQFSVFLCWLNASERRATGRQLRRWPLHQGREHTLRAYQLAAPEADVAHPQPAGAAFGPAAYWLV